MRTPPDRTGPDGIEKKHIARPVITDVIRVLFNIIRESKLQQTACSVNRTTPILKQAKHPKQGGELQTHHYQFHPTQTISPRGKWVGRSVNLVPLSDIF
jgi:hypothetical protein